MTHQINSWQVLKNELWMLFFIVKILPTLMNYYLSFTHWIGYNLTKKWTMFIFWPVFYEIWNMSANERIIHHVTIFFVKRFNIYHIGSLRLSCFTTKRYYEFLPTNKWMNHNLFTHKKKRSIKILSSMRLLQSFLILNQINDELYTD